MKVVFCTTPTDKSEEISDKLLESKLVACINILQSVKSKYWWENKIQTDEESMLIIKTKEELMEKLISEIKKIHPYEVPEIISFKIEDGNNDYLEWIKKVTI